MNKHNTHVELCHYVGKCCNKKKLNKRSLQCALK
ncbi:hypothetical protein [Plasmodium yoelii yoelii]|uniref:Uncharacterized protein n=1 Tax=Plasmodium yoelii yoelii TaxID=73239 RepID=Q7RCU2_PLAYO|nr:hypothetical protein [Plasmodium yoelii yoelii]